MSRKKIKICLVFPRLYIPNVTRGGIAPPLGILYIATFLRSKGVDCVIFDYFYKGKEVLFEFIKKNKIDIIGLSITSPSAKEAFLLAKDLKIKIPKLFIVCGGPHVSSLPRQTITDINIDAIITGEGENVLYNLVKRVEEKGITKANLAGIDGLWYKKHGKIRKNKNSTPIQNLNDLPFPDRKLVDIKRYLKNFGSMTLISSRGCPYNCIYCQPTQRKIFGNKIRRREVGNVVNEMVEIKKKHQGDYLFYFQDDSFTFDREWLKNFCTEIINRKLNFRWQCHSTVRTVDDEIIKLMVRAGCEIISFGIESGSQKILNFMRKGITVEQTVNAFHLAHKNNVLVNGFVMIGTPGETRNDLDKTVELIKKIHPDTVQISITSPMIGSDLYEYCRKNKISNIKNFDEYEYLLNRYPIRLNNLTKEDLFDYQEKIIKALNSVRYKNTLKYIKLILFKKDRKKRIMIFIKSLLEKINPPSRNSSVTRSRDTKTLFRFGRISALMKRIIKISRP